MEKSKRNALIVLGISLLLCVCMGLVDAILSPPYAVKSAIKLVLFGAVPVIYLLCTKSLSARQLFSLEKKHLALALPLAGGVFAVSLKFSQVIVFASLCFRLAWQELAFAKGYSAAEGSRYL